MSSGVIERISSEGDRHAHLLAELASLDYATSALQDASASLADLQGQEGEVSKRLAQLKAASKKEYAEWKNVQQSKYARFFVRARHGGSKDALAERVSKEEREFNEAYEQECDCAEALAVLTGQVEATQKQVDDLKAKKERHDTIDGELERMYARLFEGPTDGFPEEDEAEQALREAKRRNDTAQSAINVQAQLFAALGKARMALVVGNRKVDEALKYSTYDMYSRGSLADMMERSALAEAKRAALAGTMYYNEARRAAPQLDPLPRIDIAEGHMMSDVLFDNFFTDYQMHQRIQQSQGSLRNALTFVTAQMQQSEQRVQAAKQAAKQATAMLRQARTELLAMRRRIIIDVQAGEAASFGAATSDERPLSGDFNSYADSLLAAGESSADLPDYSTAPPPGVRFTGAVDAEAA